VSSDRLSY